MPRTITSSLPALLVQLIPKYYSNPQYYIIQDKRLNFLIEQHTHIWVTHACIHNRQILSISHILKSINTANSRLVIILYIQFSQYVCIHTHTHTHVCTYVPLSLCFRREEELEVLSKMMQHIKEYAASVLLVNAAEQSIASDDYISITCIKNNSLLVLYKFPIIYHYSLLTTIALHQTNGQILMCSLVYK